MKKFNECKQPKAKNMLLQTYFTSLVSLVLCVGMFLGTSYAWFTSEVNNAGNEIYIGILDVELEKLNKQNTNQWDSLSATKEDGTNTNKLYDSGIRWEPGYTSLETVRVVDNGDLAFNYTLTFTNGTGVDTRRNENPELTPEELKAVAEYFDVWVYHDEENKIPEAKKYDEITVENGWKSVGTLAQVLAGKPVFEGAMNTADVVDKETVHIYTIALHMNGETVAEGQEDALNALMGKKIGLNVKLVASQRSSEQDSFGNAYYDKDAKLVATEEELLEAIETAEEGDVISVAPGTYELSEALVLPSNITLCGTQAGKAAKNWATDSNAEKTVIKSTGSNVLEIRQSSEDPAEATANITIDGIMIDCSSCTSIDENGVKGIYVKKSGGEAIEGIKIANCAVVNSSNDGIDVCNAYGAVIENNYVKNVTDTAIHLGNYNGYHYETWAEVTAYVRNNVIENVTATQNGAIQIENGMGDVVVSGNIIRNVTAGSSNGYSSTVKASAIHVYEVCEGGEILIDNNTIEKADQGIAIYKYTYNTAVNEDWWKGPTTDNDVVTVSNNTISGFTIFGIKTSNLNAKNNTANETLVVINGNVLSSTDSDNAISIGTENSNWRTTSENNTFNGAILTAN